MDRQRLASGLVLLVLVAAVAPFAVFAVPELVSAGESYVVLSGSMEPTVEAGDVVLVDERAPSSIGSGDVITFKRPGEEKPTTHRVVEVTERNGERAFVTKGDANEGPDPQPVAAEHVVGTVTIRMPNLGYVVQFANTALGRVVLLLVPFLLLGLSEIRSLVAKLREGEDEEPGDEPHDPTPAGASGAEPSQVSAPALPPADVEPDDGRLVVDPTDLSATSALLLLGAGYTVYVAIRLQSQLTITAAFGSVFLLVAVGSLRVAAAQADAEDAPALRQAAARRLPPVSADEDQSDDPDGQAESTFDGPDQVPNPTTGCGKRRTTDDDGTAVDEPDPVPNPTTGCGKRPTTDGGGTEGGDR